MTLTDSSIREGDGPALLITDQSGAIISANAPASVLFATTEKELSGKAIGTILNAIAPGDMLHNLDVAHVPGTLLLSGELANYILSVTEITLHREVLFAVILFTVESPAATLPMTGTRSADMLAQKYATPEQGKAEVHTPEQEFTRLKNRFIALASHEFRSPLSSIQLSVALIERYYDRLERDKLFSHLGKIRAAIAEMTDILEEFLSQERVDAGTIAVHPEEIDVPDLCHEVLREMRLQAIPGQRLVFSQQGSFRRFHIDGNILRECLKNLLSNAIKYSGENGSIRLSAEINENGCKIILADDGLGIPAEDQQHIFEPFFRAGNVIGRQGTGLGLSLVRRYCALMNGNVSFDSREHRGTVFTLWFPSRSFPAVPG